MQVLIYSTSNEHEIFIPSDTHTDISIWRLDFSPRRAAPRLSVSVSVSGPRLSAPWLALRVTLRSEV